MKPSNDVKVVLEIILLIHKNCFVGAVFDLIKFFDKKSATCHCIILHRAAV